MEKFHLKETWPPFQLPGKLMEWTLILFGTSEHPYRSISSLQAIPETPIPEQQGGDEGEDEYDGNRRG